MELIEVRCAIDRLRIIEVTRWLHDNVGLMAVDKTLINDYAPWAVNHYLGSVPSIWYFKNKEMATLFALKWS